MIKRKNKFILDLSKSEVILLEKQTLIVKSPYYMYHGNLCTVKYAGKKDGNAKIIFTKCKDGVQIIDMGNTGITEVCIIVNSIRQQNRRMFCVYCSYENKKRPRELRGMASYYVYDRENPTVRYLRDTVAGKTTLIGDTRQDNNVEIEEPIKPKKKSIFKRLNK
jgi:hypothetical protein